MLLSIESRPFAPVCVLEFSIVWRQTPKIRGQVSYWRLPQDPEIGHKCTCVRMYFLSFFEYPVVSFLGSYNEKKTRLSIMFLWF
jgi:hypothetical protein